MNSRIGLLLLVAVGDLGAAAIDSRLLCLIPENAGIVFGVDIERYRTSRLVDFYPVDPIHRITGVKRLIQIGEGEQSLTIVKGGDYSLVDRHDTRENQPRRFAVAPDTLVFGTKALDAAIARCRMDNWRPGEFAQIVQQISGSYDNWVIIIQPLARKIPDVEELPKEAKAFVEMVEEVRAGIRLGAEHEFTAEVLMKTPEDAAVLGALGRWLPGAAQLLQFQGDPRGVHNVARNFSLTVAGRTATLTFRISERDVEERSNSRRKELLTPPIL